MKKLLSVSILAVLVAAPLAANATDPTPPYQKVTIGTDAATIEEVGNDTTKVATTGYVKGAYNAAIDVINAENRRVDGVTGVLTNLTTTDKTNLVAAINEVKSGASTDYQLKSDSNVTTDLINGVNGAGTSKTKLGTGQGVGTNLVKLDKAIVTNEDNIGNMSNLRSAPNTNLTTNDDTLVEGVVALDTKLGNVSKQTMGSTGTNVATVVGAIAELNGGASTEGSVSYKIKNDAEDADFTVSNGTTNFVTNSATASENDNTITKAVNKLDAKMGALTGLNTAEKGTLVGAINELDTDIKVATGTYSNISAGTGVAANLVALDTQVGKNTADIGATYDATTGDMNLSTTAKTIQGAINELDGDVGDKSNLTVSANSKTNLVSAINEVNSKVLTVYSDWASGGTAGGANTVALGVPTQQGSGS